MCLSYLKLSDLLPETHLFFIWPKQADISLTWSGTSKTGFVAMGAHTVDTHSGPGHCPMISKYGPSLSKAVAPVDPSFLVVKKISL